MKKRIKWYNIIPKPIQRIQARYYELKDRFIEVDYEYDKTPLEEKEEEETFYDNKKDNTMTWVLISIIIIIVFIFVLPNQYI